MEYTPTTEDVRKEYVRHDVDCGSWGRSLMYIAEPTEAESAAGFDRWLAAHDREVAATAWARGHNEYVMYVTGKTGFKYPVNPYV